MNTFTFLIWIALAFAEDFINQLALAALFAFRIKSNMCHRLFSLLIQLVPQGYNSSVFFVPSQKMIKNARYIKAVCFYRKT